MPSALSCDPESLLERLLACARRAPEAVAVRDAHGELRYGELVKRAYRLARALAARGVGPERTVGVCLPRGGDLVAAELGVMLSGGAFVPVDAESPRERLRAIFADASATCVVTDPSLEARLPADLEAISAASFRSAGREDLGDAAPATVRNAARTGPRSERRGAPRGATEAEELFALAGELAQRVSKTSLAYVIYTSGSTGNPKGVQIEHGSLWNFVAWHRDAFGLDARSRTTMVYSPGFDSSQAEIWPALTAGACVSVVPTDVRLAPDRLIAWLVAEAITLTDLPTPLVEALLQLPWPPGAVNPKTVLTGGDRLHGRPRAEHPFALFNEYGPTEATVTATSGRVEAGGEGLPSIGRPVAGARAYVLDERLERRPDGTPGDLFLGGPGVARGYLNEPALTQERFVRDPFVGDPAARMYRTGDRAVLRPDGELLFCGRSDAQVKILGHRIEPAEIVAALGAHPHVSTAHVLAHGADGSGAATFLVAYFVPKDPRFVPSSAELREHLRARVPESMIPKTFVVLDRFPLTASGKVDARALPPPAFDRSSLHHAYASPRSDLERTLVTIWQEILRFEPIGIEDDLFELGGQSLLVAQMRKRIVDALGVELSIQDVFEARSVARLGATVERLRASARLGNGAPALPPLTRAHDGAPTPLTVQQQQVWFFQKLAPSAISYQAQTSIRVFGPLDVTVLERAMTEVTRRHAILRTTYHEEAGRPHAVVHENVRATIPVVDLSALAPEERERGREAIVKRELESAIAMSALPLARWTAVRLAPEEHELILVEHHVVHDGESFGLLMRELETLYEAFEAGRPSPLPELPVQYADFARWQRAALEGPGMGAQLDFWREELRGAPTVLALPTDHPRPRFQSFRGDLVRVEMPPGLPSALRELSRREGVTLFSILFSAFATLLHRYTNEEDFCVGSAVANRGIPSTEHLIGMFVNTVVLRCHLDGEPSFRDLLHRTADVVARASMNEALPFPKLVEALGLARDVSQNPLFQVMFSFHDSVIPHPRFGRAWSTVFERGNGSSKVDLDVVVIPHAQRHLGDHERGDDRVTFLWEFNRDLFERSTVERMAGQFMRLLEAAVAEPDTELRRLPLVSDDDRAKLLGDRAPSADAAEPASVAEQVIARAVQRPDAVAVSDDSGDVRYGELVKRAYRLAQWLASRGAHAERTVAVCLPRGAALAAAELGILLSGAAFVPLDPEDPPERAHGILTDAGALCVVTDGAHAGRFPPALPSVSMDNFASQEAPESLPSPSRRGERRKAPRKDPEAAQLFEAAAALARARAKTALAYVIYTSGSTGRPKGVMVEHASFDGFVAWHRREFALDARSRTTMVYAPSFDSSLAEIWPALSAGARVVVVPPDVRLSPERLAAWLVAEKVTFTDLPTPLVERLLAIPWPNGGHLRAMAVGGDRLHARPRADHPFLLFNEYGPTEATVTATSGRVTPERLGEEDVLPSIGRPIDGTRAYVLDAHLAPVPVGAPGELYLGGRGVARGYLNQPQLTKERFLRDPFADEPGARMYRTGDRARWLGDGRLQFCGRADDQLKIRGHRIEPAEIVAALAAHPSVATAHVGPERGPSGEVALVAYVVPSPDAANLVAETLRRYASSRLPTFMRPAAYVLLDALPLTSRGKVDVHALPPPAWGGDAAPSRARAETSTERAIESSWKEALGLADVGVEDNFFDVGGNSLLLAAVHQAVERALDRKFPLLWLFEHPTIRALAMHLDGDVVEESFASPSERRIALPVAQRANNLERLQRRRRIPATEESGDA